jgi:hypothetical protein
MPGTRKGNDKPHNDKPQNEKPHDVKDEHPQKDDGHSACGNDGDCGDHQAALISADAQISALGLNVCLDVDVGGGLDLPGVELPDCLSNLELV